MRTRQIVLGLVASAFLFPGPLIAAIQLTPVVSGLSSPIFVGHAGDGSQRLFIEEQAGIIKVLQPGASVPTVFLDIRSKIATGGERGLLGLAFHPQYEVNRRFFVFYTRLADGALVIAEYAASSSNPNVASTTEAVLLTIAHSANSNHNGGMLSFGTDGYLYIGAGDGGSGNDPPNNAQNINQLLGQILRIDVDHPDPVAGTLYSSPSGNPYVNAPGRDEIFSIGWRNPWRFSFDRSTGQQWVADVGQGAREEVDTPVVLGGNYGWRVYEGFNCTGNDPGLCNPANFLPPVFDYAHSNGRCSITGGYVYRGSQGALANGTYVYGDYCTGEILTWNGSSQTLVLDTSLNISSFGEDEQGELYVVGLGGSVDKIVTTTPACTTSILPQSRNVAGAGANGNIMVTASAGCAWTAIANASWIHVTSGAGGTGNGRVAYSVDSNPSTASRGGTITIGTQVFTITQSTSCTPSISPPNATFPRSGGTGTVTVTTGAGCTWTAVSNAAWITVTGGASGSGNGTVTYAVEANTITPPRNRVATITIAGLTFSVRQVQ